MMEKVRPLCRFFAFSFKTCGICSCFVYLKTLLSLSSPQRPVGLVSLSIICQLARRHECQGSHQQGGLRAPRREDAGCRDGEAEDKEEDPLFGHRWSGRLHDLHLPLRSEIPITFSFGFVRARGCLAYSLVTLATFQVTHFNTSPLIFPLMLALMSALTFPLPTGRLIANLIYCRALGQSFLSGFSLKGLDCLGINWGLNYFVYLPI